MENNTHTHACTHPFGGPFLGLPRWASARKVKPIWILLKQETVSGSGICWAICMQVYISLQTDNHASTPPLSVLWAGCPSCRPTNSINALKAMESNTHTHTCLTTLCPGLPGWAGTRKVKPIWILLKQEAVSGSGISWAICKSAPCSRHNQASTPPLSFLQAGCPSCCPTNSVKALKA